MNASPFAAGCDVVDVARLSAAIDRRQGLLERVFTAREIADARRDGVRAGSTVERERLAARFAAKEATRKATGRLGTPLRDIEVRSGPDGAPQLWIRGRRSALACSLSHDAGIALAVVVGAYRDTEPAPTADHDATNRRADEPT